MSKKKLAGFLHLAFASLLFLTVGCSNEPASTPVTTTWTSISANSLSEAQTAQREKAVAARDALGKQLKSRLVAAIGQDGPAHAIGVCSDEAGPITKAVAKEHGVAIGRTSFKLRSAANNPPQWAKPLIEDRVSEPTFLAGPKEQLAALLPIHIDKKCLVCHGPVDALHESVQKQITDLYTNDAATGYEEGDLRGWFWVEVPAAE